MKTKKIPKLQLENFSKIFFQIGLALTLFIIYSLLEYKTYEYEDIGHLGQVTMTEEIKEEIPIVQIKIETPPPKATPVIVEKIKVVENDVNVEEGIIETTEIEESDAVVKVDVSDIVEVSEAEEIEEDIPFLLIESVPVFPGCKGNNQELRDCFNKKVTAYFTKNFDPNISQDLGLTSGKRKLFVVFKINKNGDVIDVVARAPHPTIEKEVTKIIKSLPKMTPGKQRNSPVKVSYSLPITFWVLDN